MLFIISALVWATLPVHFLQFISEEYARSRATNSAGRNWWYISYSGHFFISLWLMLHNSPFAESLWGFPAIGILYMGSMIGQRVMVSKVIDRWNEEE